MTEALSPEQMQELISHLQEENARLRQEVERLREENRKWARLAGTDNLTGLPNRISYLRAIVPSEIRKALAEERPISFVLLAADHLGDINQKYGRAAGDQVIKGLAAYLKPLLEEDEKLGHIDGTNFALVLHSDIEDATTRARKWRTQIKNHPFECGDTTTTTTVSVGITSIRRTEVKDARILTDIVFKRLNEVLYEAKKEGGNAVEVYPETEVSSSEAKGL
jgi:diguanylate cyclase (GGDEF)-like protein